MRVLVCVCAVLVAAAPVLADKAKGDAEALAGQKLYEGGKYHDAAVHFVAAYEADPQPAYLFNIAQAYRFAKECTNAAKYFRLFLDATKQVEAQNLDKVHHYLDEMDACAKTEAPPAPAPPAPQPVVAPAPVPATVPQHDEPADPGHGKRTLGLAIGAAGIVGLAAGAYFTHRVSAISDEAQAWENANCTTASACPADVRKMQQDAFASKGSSAETKEVVAYSLGGAALVTGAVLYMLGRGGEEHVAAVPTSGGAMVLGAFRF